ncbi:hypothetical protein GJ699_24440 [Duganella sp. FT80W]|uniref:Uncharacterized protein n=1 Tax=Duganella guangzhouensis TaxID=2666084 RepID=A0A6I2L5S7_9BURK|nr:hypothetical protein [Duganella guangzhouensis]MRW93153.1 hypothetical protein [Duganella guangzhouensis]
MKMHIAILVACLSTGAWAQSEPDPAVKSADGKTTPAKQKAAKSPCAGMQGGVDASGGESVEQHSKTSKATANNSAACGKHNGKADKPEAAPTTANPQDDPVTRK